MDRDLIIDCTGVLKASSGVQPCCDARVKKVMISAPIKEQPVLDLVYGVNHDL